jgi:hypothetical protein
VDQYGRSIESEGAPADEGAPAPGTKRFELRTGRGLDEAAITIEGKGTLRKEAGASAEPSCAYIDLPPGRHVVHLRARAQNPEAGMEPALFLREYGSGTQSWYDTFQMRCGGDGRPCELGHMEAFVAEVQKTPRGLFDPCGSTRVEGVRWNALRTVGALLGEVTIDLTLDVYKFAPRFRHGSPTCKGPAPGE